MPYLSVYLVCLILLWVLSLLFSRSSIFSSDFLFNFSSSKFVNIPDRMVHKLNLSESNDNNQNRSFSDGLNESPGRGLVAAITTDTNNTEQQSNPLLEWIEVQRNLKGDYPLMKLTPQIVHLMTGDTKLTNQQQKELALFFGKKIAAQATSAPTQQITPKTAPSYLPVLAPTMFQALHPISAQRCPIVPSSDPNKFHRFKNERDELSKAINLNQKLGVQNSLAPIDVDKVLKTEAIKGWNDPEIQTEVEDLKLLSSHLIWLGIMYQNDAHIRDLRSRRVLINDPKYTDLKELYRVIEMGTPM